MAASMVTLTVAAITACAVSSRRQTRVGSGMATSPYYVLPQAHVHARAGDVAGAVAAASVVAVVERERDRARLAPAAARLPRADVNDAGIGAALPDADLCTRLVRFRRLRWLAGCSGLGGGAPGPAQSRPRDRDYERRQCPFMVGGCRRFPGRAGRGARRAPAERAGNAVRAPGGERIVVSTGQAPASHHWICYQDPAARITNLIPHD